MGAVLIGILIVQQGVEESEKTLSQSLIMVFHEILKFITLMAKSLWKKKASLI